MKCEFDRNELADILSSLLFRGRYQDRKAIDKINDLLADDYEKPCLATNETKILAEPSEGRFDVLEDTKHNAATKMCEMKQQAIAELIKLTNIGIPFLNEAGFTIAEISTSDPFQTTFVLQHKGKTIATRDLLIYQSVKGW